MSNFINTIQFTAIFFALSCSSLFARELKFYKNGKLVKVIPQEKLLSVIKSKKVEFYNKEGRTTQKFNGFTFPEILDFAYGRSWREMSEILFKTKNGFHPIKSVERFKLRLSYLNYERVDIDKFVIIGRNTKKVRQLAPYYLSWKVEKGMSQKKKAKDGWVYQVTGIDLIDKKHPITPLVSKTSPTYKGYTHFKQYCLTCHSLSGYGGTISMDMNSPNVIKAKGRDYFMKYITKELDNKARFSKNVLDKDQALKDIATFLEYIGGDKYQPQRRQLFRLNDLNKTLQNSRK